MDADRTSIGGTGAATTVDVPLSATTAEGDLLIMVTRHKDTTTTTVAGWVQLWHQLHSAFGNWYITGWYRIADGTEIGSGVGGAAPGFTRVVHAGGPTDDGTAALVWTIKGATLPLVVPANTSGSGTSYASPAVQLGRGEIPHLLLAIGTSMNGAPAAPGPQAAPWENFAVVNVGSGDRPAIWGNTMKWRSREAVQPAAWGTFNGWDHYSIAIPPKRRDPSIQR